MSEGCKGGGGVMFSDFQDDSHPLCLFNRIWPLKQMKQQGGLIIFLFLLPSWHSKHRTPVQHPKGHNIWVMGCKWLNGSHVLQPHPEESESNIMLCYLQAAGHITMLMALRTDAGRSPKN